MDTKLKNNANKWVATSIVLCLIVLISIGLVVVYPRIEESLDDDGYNPFEQESFIGDLYNSNEVLYYQLKRQMDDSLKPEDLFIDSSYIYDDGKYLREEINQRIDYNDRVLDTGLASLDYYAIDRDSGAFLSRGADDLLNLIDNDSDEKIGRVDELYNFYLVVDYDKYGELNIVRIKGANERVVYEEFLEKFWQRRESFEASVNPIRNTTIIYGIRNSVLENAKYYSDDMVTNYVLRLKERALFSAFGSYLVIGAVLVVLSALLIPYAIEKNMVGMSKWFKVPLEFHIAFITAVLYLVLETPGNIVLDAVNGEISYFFGIDLSSMQFSWNQIFFLNTVFWCICSAIVFMYVVLLKHVFNKGIINYLRDDTIVGSVVNSTINSIKGSIDRFSKVDLQDNINQKILKILGFNLIVLFIMSSVWFFGIIIAIVYSFYLYRKITDYYKKVNDDYSKVLAVTGEMAKGNLDVTIPENVGVFDSIKDDLSNIHTGFKKAVDEEVKSERMKTDLITNVSHDLKTPLTSIITYVDLLKTGDISEKDRKMYLDIIDNKAQRLQTVIEDLFEMSKATSGNVELNLVEVDIKSLIKQILLEYSMKIDEKGLIVRTNFPEEKVLLMLDSQKTFRVFENLIINISKYSMANTRIYIDVFNFDDEVEVSLKNVSEQEINFDTEEITERFVRGDKSRNTQGSGLGLAIAKNFVEIQGGVFKIDVDGDLFKVDIKFRK